MKLTEPGVYDKDNIKEMAPEINANLSNPQWPLLFVFNNICCKTNKKITSIAAKRSILKCSEEHSLVQPLRRMLQLIHSVGKICTMHYVENTSIGPGAVA